MKKIRLLPIGLVLFFALFCLKSIAQVDTLFNKKGEKIPCKITEIGEEDIRYLNVDEYDGPVYVMSKIKIYKYVLANGKEVMVVPDELSVEHHHSSIMHKRSVIKIHPFSKINQSFTMAYEQVLKVGTSICVEAGYVNNSLSVQNYQSFFPGVDGQIPDLEGFFIKPGYKFLVGQDYSLKGMKYSHPLKGRFISLEVAFSYLGYNDVLGTSTYDHINNTSSAEVYDLNTYAYGLMINYGRQFILGNIITLEYYLGVGMTGQSFERSNSYIVEQPNHYYGESEVDPNLVYNYRGFYRSPNLGLSGAFGFRLGYILPAKEKPQD